MQQRERALAVGRAEAVKDSPAHALRARAFRTEEFSRVFVLGDDRCHATGLDAARADGGARRDHRRFVGGHETRRPRQTGQAHARITRAAEIAIHSAVALIDPRPLHVPRLFYFHCLVSFLWNSSSGHGLSSSTGSGSPNCSTVRSWWTSAPLTLLPALAACLSKESSGGLRGLRGLRAGLLRPSTALASAMRALASALMRASSSRHARGSWGPSASMIAATRASAADRNVDQPSGSADSVLCGG